MVDFEVCSSSKGVCDELQRGSSGLDLPRRKARVVCSCVATEALLALHQKWSFVFVCVMYRRRGTLSGGRTKKPGKNQVNHRTSDAVQVLASLGLADPCSCTLRQGYSRRQGHQVCHTASSGWWNHRLEPNTGRQSVYIVYMQSAGDLTAVTHTRARPEAMLFITHTEQLLVVFHTNGLLGAV